MCRYWAGPGVIMLVVFALAHTRLAGSLLPHVDTRDGSIIPALVVGWWSGIEKTPDCQPDYQ